MRPRTLPALTGLRFPLALAVLLFHYAEKPAAGAPFLITGIIHNGFAAVSAFFVLSGFILSYTYAGDEGELRGSRWGFWSARFARVYPIYVLSILLIYQGYLMTMPGSLLTIFVATVSTFTLTQAWIPAAALSINSAGWSLSVEAFLYACFPFLLPRLKTGRGRLLLLFSLCVCGAILPALMLPTNESLTAVIRYNPLFHLCSFLIGMIVERLTRNRRLPAWTGWLSLIAIVAGFGAGSSIPYEILNNGLLALPFAVLIACLSTGMKPLSNLLSSRPLVELGNASYCLYILHLPLEPAVLTINAQTFGFGKFTWGFVAEAVVFCVSVSLVVFRFMENPYRQRIREHLLKMRPSSSTGLTPQTTTVN